MSRYSSKCCDHVEKTQFLVRNHHLYFCYLSRTAAGRCFGFPEFASGSSLPAAGSYRSGSLGPR
jgi:hypothetical protein